MASIKDKAKAEQRSKEILATSEQLRVWAIQKGITPRERYAVGATGTYHTCVDYCRTILPLWCPKSVAWSNDTGMPPMSCFFALARGGILETNYVPMRNVWTGQAETIYVCDSEKTRSVLRRLQSFPIQQLGWRYVKTMLVQQTFEEGWLMLFEQVIKLKKKLEKFDWKDNLDGQSLNLARHLRLGEIIDMGLMPPDLMVIALRLITVWLQDYLANTHSSGGKIKIKKGGAYRNILVVYGYTQLVHHKKIRLVEFYRSNLYHAPAKFRRAKL